MMAIPTGTLEELRTCDDAGRKTVSYVDGEGGLPLRCCLARSLPGDEVALVSYAPLRRWAAETGADPGAYLELGPVFIHASDCGGPAGGYPEALHGNDCVLRAYDREGRIHGGVVVPPGGGPDAVARWFEDPEVALIHVRAIEYGCFMFEVRR